MLLKHFGWILGKFAPDLETVVFKMRCCSTHTILSIYIQLTKSWNVLKHEILQGSRSCVDEEEGAKKNENFFLIFFGVEFGLFVTSTRGLKL
jgi:hypothetical protein